MDLLCKWIYRDSIKYYIVFCILITCWSNDCSTLVCSDVLVLNWCTCWQRYNLYTNITKWTHPYIYTSTDDKLLTLENIQHYILVHACMYLALMFHTLHLILYYIICIACLSCHLWIWVLSLSICWMMWFNKCQDEVCLLEPFLMTMISWEVSVRMYRHLNYNEVYSLGAWMVKTCNNCTPLVHGCISETVIAENLRMNLRNLAAYA